MALPNPKVAGLSAAERDELEAVVLSFDCAWTEECLPQHVVALPREAAWRMPALWEMIKVDLERQWQVGRAQYLDAYLASFPELGTAHDVSPELIAAECEARQLVGKPATTAELVRRFPLQAPQVEQILRLRPDNTFRPLAAGEPAGTVSFPLSTPSRRQVRQEPMLPEQFGRYRILKRLGVGGMGTVYLATDTQLGREVAIKVPHFSDGDGPDVIARFYREARAAATLRHPNICPIFDVSQQDGVHFMTLGYIGGRPLSDLVAGVSGKRPDERRAAGIICKLAETLAEAHAHGIVHRDLKPSNIMIDDRGEPIVMDFGLAQRIDDSATRLTHTGSLIGTPAYMAPEQVRGELQVMGPSCDIYSLGVILYELLVGRRPFSGTLATVLYQIVHEDPSPPNEVRTGIDSQLSVICLRAIAKRPENRFRSMSELSAALQLWLTPLPVEPRPAARPHRIDSGMLLAGSAAAGTILLGILAWGLVPPRAGLDRAAISAVATPTVAVAPFDHKQAAAHQQAWADYLRVRPVARNSIGMRLALIPPGEFTMGSTPAEIQSALKMENHPRLAEDNPIQAEGPAHRVVFSRPWYCGVAEVTVGEFRKFVTATNYITQRERASAPVYDSEGRVFTVRGVSWHTPGHPSTDDSPVGWVSWEDAAAFCNWLSIEENFAPPYQTHDGTWAITAGNGYHLPTEAQWEYACRAGTTAAFAAADDERTLLDIAWTGRNSTAPHRSGEKPANSFRLVDIQGNLEEWSQDWYSSGYADERQVDPSGFATGTSRVLRGGNFSNPFAVCFRPTYRHHFDPSANSSIWGFRVVRDLGGNGLRANETADK